MQVKDLMNPSAVTVEPTSTAALAARLISRHNVGALPVCGPDRRLRGAGYAPYYLYRQKYMSGSFENVGWTRPGGVCAYNIVMMEELQSVLSLGAGGITKLVDPERRKIVRLNNPKYAKEYLDGWDKAARAKEEAARCQQELARRT